MSGIIQGVNVNTASIETLNNVFRTELGRLGVSASAGTNYRGLTNLLKSLVVKEARTAHVVRGTIQYNQFSSNQPGASGTAPIINTVAVNNPFSASSTFPILNNKLYFASAGVNYPVFVMGFSLVTIIYSNTTSSSPSLCSVYEPHTLFLLSSVASSGVLYSGVTAHDSVSGTAASTAFHTNRNLQTLGYSYGDNLNNLAVYNPNPSLLTRFNNTVPYTPIYQRATYNANQRYNIGNPNTSRFFGFVLLPS